MGRTFSRTIEDCLDSPSPDGVSEYQVFLAFAVRTWPDKPSNVQAMWAHALSQLVCVWLEMERSNH